MCFLPDTTSLFFFCCCKAKNLCKGCILFWTADSRHLFAVKYDIGGFLVIGINTLKKVWLQRITQMKTHS